MGSAVALKEGVHDRLIQEIDHVSAIAKVPVDMIKHSSTELVGPSVLDWLKRFKEQRKAGTASAYLIGKDHKPVDRTMMASAAVLIRNFIDARVTTLASLLDGDTDAEEASVLFVPNFQTGFHGKPLAAWQVQKLYSLLLDRRVSGKVTVLYIDSLDELESQYGAAVADHIKDSYTAL